MAKQSSTIIIIIALFFSSCDIEQNIKETITDTSEQAAIMLADSVEYEKENFNNICQASINVVTDTITVKKINALHFSITTTSKYIDSLRKVMNKLDNMGVKNNETVKEIFLDNGVGDSLFNKLNSSIILAENIATNQTIKSSVKNIGDNMLLQRNPNEFKNQYFSLNSTGGVSWLLSGMEIELFKAGSTSLKSSK